MTAAASRHLGLDLGATNLKWAVMEVLGPTWTALDRGQVATRASGGPDAVVAQLGQVAADAMTRWPGIATTGIGIPGGYDPQRGTTRLLINVPGDWTDRPLVGPLQSRLGTPVAMINDARAFGLAELRMGAGRGASSMVGLTLGTGVGGVVAIDGHLHLGHDGSAGEIGHQTIDASGPSCRCGNHGCLEAFVRADRLAAACGASSPKAAVAAARAGDSRALAGFDQVGRYLGIGIANVITVLTPDRVVIGGGVSAAGDLILRPILEELALRVRMTDLARVSVVTAELGTWAGAVGAAVHGAEQAAAGQVGRA